MHSLKKPSWVLLVYNLNYQVETLDDFKLSDPEDKCGMVVYHDSILQLALGLDHHHVPRHGSGLAPLPLLQSLHQDALLDVTIPSDVPPVILGLKDQ